MSSRPLLTLIAAVSADGFISTGKGMPWHLPRDTAHFRHATCGQWLLIGRRTYQEMLGWFQDHQVLVLTHDQSFVPTVGQVVSSVAEAQSIAEAGGAQELFVCGGGETYAAAMPLAGRLILTQVDILLGDGVPFPPISAKLWQIFTQHTFPADEKNPHGMCFATYLRRQAQTTHATILENSR